MSANRYYPISEGSPFYAGPDDQHRSTVKTEWLGNHGMLKQWRSDEYSGPVSCRCSGRTWGKVLVFPASATSATFAPFDVIDSDLYDTIADYLLSQVPPPGGHRPISIRLEALAYEKSQLDLQSESINRFLDDIGFDEAADGDAARTAIDDEARARWADIVSVYAPSDLPNKLQFVNRCVDATFGKGSIEILKQFLLEASPWDIEERPSEVINRLVDALVAGEDTSE